jgi:hypothetical protein
MIKGTRDALRIAKLGARAKDLAASRLRTRLYVVHRVSVDGIDGAGGIGVHRAAAGDTDGARELRPSA